MWQPRSAAPRTRTCAHDRARRSDAPGNQAAIGRRRSLSWNLGGGTCAHDATGKKKNMHATLRSGSELISLSDRILLLVACRPRVRVKRACAVGMARRGAQKGRLGAPCNAGGHCWPLTHGCRCRRAPQIRAMGDPIGRAAPPHERSQPRTAHEPRRSDAMCW
jgi:hypothetical protein